MNLAAGLKTIAKAVGDGKLVALHAYVKLAEGRLHATDGKMEVVCRIEDEQNAAFCVRHDLLVKALERPESSLHNTTDHGLVVRAGRARTTLRGVPLTDFPHIPVQGEGVDPVQLGANERLLVHQLIKDMAPFCGSSDNHIWQMGIHFKNDVAFAANPYGMILHYGEIPVPLRGLTLPPWAVRFMLAQEQPLAGIVATPNQYRMFWPDGVFIKTTTLIESAPDVIERYVRDLATAERRWVDVPVGIDEALERLKGYGAKTAFVGDNMVKHSSDTIEFEEALDFDIETTPRQWNIDLMLAALKHADEWDLSNGNAVWRGNGYFGAFAGMA